MTTPPASPPLSWLLLEQYALGELDPATHAAVEAQLARSEADRAVLQQIEADASDLPPLWPTTVEPPARTRKAPRRTVAWPLTAGLLAAAAALLMVRSDPPTGPTRPPAQRSYKGGELSLRVVTEHGQDADRPRPGQRLKLLVTCPPSASGALQVVVFQGGARDMPLPDVALPCGNSVPWPGAFALDSEAPADVCVGEPEAVARAHAAADLGPRGVCAHLE